MRTCWVPLVLLLLAVVLLFNPLPFHNPAPAAVKVAARVLDPTPVRQPDFQPDYRVGVFVYQCNDCHAIIQSPPVDIFRSPIQHKEVVLQHGINTSCFNCHLRTDRDAFAGDLDVPIPWDQPQLLCAKCHGPVFRDWEHGSHGRSEGYWDKKLGKQRRVNCIECHDPHHPPFPPLKPAPPPHTLRMGQPVKAEHTGPHNPLRLKVLGTGAKHEGK